MTGTIIKGIAGFYYVAAAESGIYECKAKGLFRKEGVKPLVGDRVRIRVLDEAEKEANIEEILPRKNRLLRPAVANVDQVICVLALASPDPNFGLLDRMLLQMEQQELPAVLCLNKMDLAADTAQDIRGAYEKAGYRVILCSAKEKSGLDELAAVLRGKASVVAGPSGVGKSSLVNLLSPEVRMETGEISSRLKRGRHTTRHSQFIVLEENTYLCDTPGFTSFAPETIEKEKLRSLFPELRPYEGRCRFLGCAHVSEPDCAVKEAVAAGAVSKQRYDSYVQLYRECAEQEKNKYK